MRKILFIGALIFLACSIAKAQVAAASCSESDVQTAINSATEGETVNIPSCPSGVSWTGSGDTISGKGILLEGAGAGRVIAVDADTTAQTLTTGSKTFSHVTNDMGATAYLDATAPPITNGETLLIYELGFLANYMEGTVTSFSGSTLVMNITSAGGTCGTTVANAMNSNCKRWLITTLPSTVLINNLTSGSMFTVTEDSSVHTTITGINFAQGSGGGGAGTAIYLNRNNSGGLPVLIHDNFFWSNLNDLVDGDTNRGVVWNNSFAFSPFSTGQYAAYRIKDPNNSSMPTSWSSVALWGNLDTNENTALYFETNDLHAAGAGTDWDDNTRTVFRYNVMDNFALSSHGADTSYVGMRYAEVYNNVGIFEAYSDGSTANIANAWFFMRGGTLLWHDNTLPALSSSDWGTKPDIDLAVLTLQRTDNYSCWGSGFSTAGEYYPAPRQIGFGYVTGTGTVTYPPLGYSAASTTTVGLSNPAYVGDSEPVYIWNNSRTQTIGIIDNNPDQCTNADTAANYVISARDYYNGTAKPSYTPAAYPNPLTQTSPTPPAPAPAFFLGQLKASGNVQGAN